MIDVEHIRKSFEAGSPLAQGSALHMLKEAESALAAKDAEIEKLKAALAGILENRETVGAGASIFQCTTAQVNAARAALKGDAA